eukprot:scaffold4619_cov59-Cyclotella_meneghiniana.AAC.2
MLYLLFLPLPLLPDDRWDGAELDQALDLVDKLEEKAEEQPERLEKLEKDRVRDTGMTRPTLLDDRQIATRCDLSHSCLIAIVMKVGRDIIGSTGRSGRSPHGIIHLDNPLLLN